jgi:photosystem II stability/assembly factor-like uncharacterized protein
MVMRTIEQRSAINLRSVFWVVLVFAIVWLTGCASAQHPATAAMPGSYHDFRIHMVDASNGWMEADRFVLPGRVHVLRTADGGQSWTDVTPDTSTNKIWSCEFPKSQMAWVSYDDGKTRLLLSTNAGRSWAPWKPLGGFDNDTHNFFLGGEYNEYRFFNKVDGLAKLVDFGACQAEYNFFESHDGGMSWQPAPVTQAGWTASDEITGTFRLGDCDGSAISYYPPGKAVVIANGDLMDETAKGVVRLNVTQDAGRTWRDVQLPLPEKYRDGLVASCPPHFFDKQNAWLPVVVEKWDSPVSWTNSLYRVLIFYATTDGGNSWKLAPAVLDSREPGFNNYTFLSPREILIQRDTKLYVTRDGAQSWQVIEPGLGEGERVLQMDFVDAGHGWLVAAGGADSSGGNKESLYRTTDGGTTWQKVSWNLTVRPGEKLENNCESCTSKITMRDGKYWAGTDTGRLANNP